MTKFYSDVPSVKFFSLNARLASVMNFDTNILLPQLPLTWTTWTILTSLTVILLSQQCNRFLTTATCLPTVASMTSRISSFLITFTVAKQLSHTSLHSLQHLLLPTTINDDTSLFVNTMTPKTQLSNSLTILNVSILFVLHYVRSEIIFFLQVLTLYRTTIPLCVALYRHLRRWKWWITLMKLAAIPRLWSEILSILSNPQLLSGIFMNRMRIFFLSSPMSPSLFISMSNSQFLQQQPLLLKIILSLPLKEDATINKLGLPRNPA